MPVTSQVLRQAVRSSRNEIRKLSRVEGMLVSMGNVRDLVRGVRNEMRNRQRTVQALDRLTGRKAKPLTPKQREKRDQDRAAKKAEREAKRAAKIAAKVKAGKAAK